MNDLQSLQRVLEASNFEEPWSEDGAFYAAELLLRLDDAEWSELVHVIPLQSKLWKLSLASVLHDVIHPGALQCLRVLLTDKDEDVFYEAAVALEASLRAGAEASAYFLEFQDDIEHMKRQVNKEFLGIYTLEKWLQDAISDSQHEVNP